MLLLGLLSWVGEDPRAASGWCRHKGWNRATQLGAKLGVEKETEPWRLARRPSQQAQS